MQPLLDAPSAAVLTTYRKDGTALTTPVWFRFHAGAFEVVLAEGDVKGEHLARTPRCILVVFEAVPPFRGVEVKGQPELIAQDVTEVREAIAGRYLGCATGIERQGRPVNGGFVAANALREGVPSSRDDPVGLWHLARRRRRARRSREFCLRCPWSDGRD